MPPPPAEEPEELLKYIRADTADGMHEDDWTQFEVVADLVDDRPVDEGISMAIVNGQPAIAFGTARGLKYAYYSP